MNRTNFFGDQIRFVLKFHAAAALLLLLFCGTASALITASPRNINISQGMNNSIQIFYQAQEPDPMTYSAISNLGRFETPEGGLLGQVNLTSAITLVNGHGSATERITVPSGVIRQALELNLNRIFFRRTFTPTILDLMPETVEVELRIVPSSIGQFALTRMELVFNLPASGEATRPPSGGRITVARNTRGLTAMARLAYNGSGTLRGEWRVDGQIIDHVVRYLPSGLTEVVITGPMTPGFPTYATGLHRVEFEILEPEPGFSEPVIFYYVSDDPPGPPLGSLKLIAPADRQHIRLMPEKPPEFSWEPVRRNLVYHFRIYSLETNIVHLDISDIDLTDKKPLVAALTRETSYRISIFDLNRIVEGIPYIWQVTAHEGNIGVAAGIPRMVYFAVSPDSPISSKGKGHDTDIP